ncbi:MAG: tetratricopeptide repeat protein, partial [Planctomycetes bacterium]|nr:tetratricopeptide repeat protein [Planctomycetota bacterium]
LAASVLALRPRPAWRRGLWATAPHWALALVYLAFTRLTLKPGPPDPLEESLIAFSPALPSFTLWTYEKLLLLPINLCVDRGFAVPQAALGLTLLSVGVLVALTWLAFSDRQDTRRVTLLGLCWFLLALAPYLNLIPIRVRPLAEQRLFTASLGFCLLFGLMLAHARISLGLSCAVPLALTCLTSERNFIWRDLRTMSLDTTLGAPEVARTRHNLGYGYWLQDYPAAAEREYKHALRLRRTPMTLRSLALARASRGDTEQAIGLLHESLALRPEAITHRLLGKLEHQFGRHSAALEHYEAAIRLKPDALTWLRMGHVHEDLRKLDDAADCFRKALAADPLFAPGHFALGNVHAKRGDDKAAIAFYSHATALDPAYADAHHNMGLSHLRLGDASAASRDLEQATAADPNHRAAWLHLGHLRREQSDPVRAAAAYAQAVRLDSRDAQAHYGLGLSLLATGQREAAARHLDMAQRLNPQLVAPRE